MAVSFLEAVVCEVPGLPSLEPAMETVLPCSVDVPLVLDGGGAAAAGAAGFGVAVAGGAPLGAGRV